jgi:hypothetical protein
VTKLPHENRNVTARLDLEPYKLPAICAVPGCGTAREAGDGHHVWRRSFGPSFREAWWVEVPLVGFFPNRVGLCSDHHQRVTENEAEIRAICHQGSECLLYVTAGHSIGIWSNEQGWWASPKVDMQLDMEGGEKPHDDVCAEHEPDEPCDRCKGTGRIRRRKKREEREERNTPRPKTTWSVRVPRDSRENGHQILTDDMDRAVELLHEAGHIRDVNRGAFYYALCFVLAWFFQTFDPTAEAQPTERSPE